MRALDLFCCAGGAAMGLHRAGFEVYGCDIRPQPRYPFRFIQGDALNPPFRLEDFDLVWASPPCQAYTVSGAHQRSRGTVYPDLVAATRAMLESSGVPWIIENVPGAPIRADVTLVGVQFSELRVVRKRLFELGGWWCLSPSAHPEPGIVTHGDYHCAVGNGIGSWIYRRGKRSTAADLRRAMGIDWMRRSELTQAVPPPYAEFLGRQFLAWRAAA